MNRIVTDSSAPRYPTKPPNRATSGTVPSSNGREVKATAATSVASVTASPTTSGAPWPPAASEARRRPVRCIRTLSLRRSKPVR
jgi:hypothetical protein